MFSRRTLFLAAPVALGLSLGACAPVDPGFGETLKYDMVAQTVDPEPRYPAEALAAGSSGTHGQKATERYRKDAVKPVEREKIGNGNSSGSGGNSGGGGNQ